MVAGTGRTAEMSKIVGVTDSAAQFGDDLPAAASTPFVLGLAEVACHNLVRPMLGPGEVTVGVRAQIEHIRPSAVGSRLTAKSRLIRRRDRRYYFDIIVWEGDKVVARVKHVRAVVDAGRLRQSLG